MSTKTLSAMAFSIATVVLLASAANADQVIIGPTDDSYVWSGDPDDNNGDYVLLNIERTTALWAFTLVQFDLSPYSGADVYGAYLRLYIYWLSGNAYPPYYFWIARNAGSWDEMTVTWDNKPDTDVWRYVVDPVYEEWWTIEVTDWVDGFVSGDHDNYGFTLGTFDNDENIDAFRMWSKEYSDPNFHPELELHYYPAAVHHNSLGSIKALFK